MSLPSKHNPRVSSSFQNGAAHLPLPCLKADCDPRSAAGPESEQNLSGREGRLGLKNSSAGWSELRASREMDVDSRHSTLSA
jgi:hypothetical protein